MDKISDEKLKTLIDSYSTDLLRMCYLYVNDIEISHDIVQNVFIKTYLNYNSFRNESTEKTWITRIAINECKNYLNSAWKKRIVLTNYFHESSDNPIVTDYEDNELLSLVQELPVKYKEIIILYYYEELKIREISSILHLRESTIGSRLKKARILLEEKMKETNVYEKFQRLL